MNTSAAVKYRILFTLLVVTVFIFTITGELWSNAYALDIPTDTPASEPAVTETPHIEVINPYFSIQYSTLSDGTPVSVYIINGPPAPPPEYAAERVASIKPIPPTGILPDFPSFSWVFGCSAVSGAMIAGYYDRGAYPNMYTGPTNGGVMPVTDTSWPLWYDGYKTYPNNPLIASHINVDGRTTRGSIDDYWVQYESTADDPYITGGWVQHTWGSAIGDYMKTSQSAAPYNNVDGSTSFYNYNSNAKLTCTDMEGYGIDSVDGTYGRKLFYEARGYAVSDCYNQKTDNNYSGGFSLVNFKAEIDAGYAVLLNLAGHSIVGYGYEGSTIYIRDTWSSDPGFTPTMPWGGSYQGMELLSVSVVHLTSSTTPTPTRTATPTKTTTRTPTRTPIRTPPNSFGYLPLIGKPPTPTRTPTRTITRTPTRTPTRTLALTATRTPTRTVTPIAGFQNGNFEQGPVAWTQYSTHGYPLILQSADLLVPPYDGTWAVWLGGDYDETAYIQQQVSVPAGQPYLSYWHWIASADICGYDIGGVQVNGTTVDAYWLCDDNDTNSWVQRVIDLSAYAGQSVSIQIRAVCDGSLNSNLFIDHVAFQSSPKASDPVPVDIIDIDVSTLKKDGSDK